LISLLDDDREFFKSQIGLEEPWATARQFPLSHSFCQHIVPSRSPLIVADARRHPLLRDSDAIRDLKVISYCGVPLQDEDGHILGSLCVIAHEPTVWTPEQVETLRELGTIVMTAIRTRHLARQAAEANQDLRDAVANLARVNHALHGFTAMAAHDLATPLGTMRRILDELEAQAQVVDDPEEHGLGRLGREIASTERLVKDLLEIASAEHSATAAAPTEVELEPLLDEIVERMGVAVEEPRVTEPRLSVYADPDHVTRIVMNLLENARRYGEPPVALHARRSDGWVEIEVVDSGEGVPTELVERMFDRFTRSGSRGGGNGLGLAIVQALTSANGGSIHYKRDGGQSRFILRLPPALGRQAPSVCR